MGSRSQCFTTISPQETKPWRLNPLITIILIILLVFGFAEYEWMITLGFDQVMLLCSVVTMFATWTVYRFVSKRFFSVAFVYLMVFLVFHFGIVIPYSFGLVDSEVIQPIQRWWYSDQTIKAVYSATIGVLSFSLSVAILSRPINRDVQMNRPDDQTATILMSLVGTGLVIGSTLLWFFFTIQGGGFGVFLGNYANYREATTGAPMQWIWFLLGVGACFLAASPPSDTRRLGVAVFLFLAVLALPLGLRGEILFCIAAASVLLARHRKMPSTIKVFIGIGGLLLLISLLKELRAFGIGMVPDDGFDFGIIAGLMELGGSIRPVAAVVGWQEAGEPYLRGASYWAPIDRQLCKLISPNSCIPAMRDERLLGQVASSRGQSFGFSVIAEAYKNFALPGVAVVMSLVGALLSFLDRWAYGWWREAITGIILVTLLVNVRNSFTPVPVQLALGCIVVAAIAVWASFSRRSVR